MSTMKMKKLAFGLWMVWVCGIFFIGVSFYATHMIKDTLLLASDPTPAVTVFTAPRAFVGSRQQIAVTSWLGLSSSLNVVLFSQDSAALAFAAAFGSRVSVDPNIDFSFSGTPFFHSMVARAQASSSDISVLIDPERPLSPDFLYVMQYAAKLDQDWLLVASSTNSDTSMVLAWNNGDVPLHNGVIPPFLYGKGIHNHWVLAEALSSDYRFVFDASWTMSSSYLEEEASNDSEIENRNWEFNGNVQLGKLYGSFSFRGANVTNLFRFCKCGGGRYPFFANTEQNIVYPLGGDHKPFSLRSKRGKKILECVDSVKLDDSSFVKKQLEYSSDSLSLPYSLEHLLSLRADQNRTIVLAVAGYSYKDMLMSWVCRLNHLHISNFLVAAIDPKLYEFSVLQGLPVFAYEDAPGNISFDSCHFGTECFQKVTKVKSRMVLQMLKKGYNVVMSDVDVYWFRNPLPLLTSFGPAIIAAQSDEFKTTGAINLPRRLNSGFYYANSDSQTIAGLQKVVEHALVSNQSEQPSFYDTLCGEDGSYRVGDDRCQEPETNLTVHFLDRDLFPNGAYKDLWQERNVRETCEKKGCFVLHNNWINSRRKKVERQVSSGLWEYDMSTRMCLKSWHHPTPYF